MIKKVKKVFSSDIGKSISTGYLVFFINNIVALFLTPYMLQFITKEEYGLYILCIDFLAWVGFLEFGTNKVIESKAGHLIVNKDYESLNRTFNTSLFFQIAIALFILPFFYFLVQSGIQESEVRHVQIVITLFSVSAALTVFKSLYSALIIASKKVYLDNKIKLYNNILNYVLVLSLVPLIGVVGLAFITFLTFILVVIRSRNRVKKLFPQLNVRKEFFDTKELKSLFSMGMYFSIGSIATLLLMKIDSYIIAKDFGFEQVALFYVTIKLFTLTQKIFQMVLKNFRPHISQLYGKKDFKRIYSFFALVSPITLSALAIGISVIMLINKFFVDIWVGEDFYISDEFSILFGFWILLELNTITSRITLTASLHNLRWISLFRIFEAMCRILIVFFFISGTGINILPFSSLVSCILFGNFFFHYQMRRYFIVHGIEMKSYIIFVPSALLICLLLLYFYKAIEIFPYILMIVGMLYGTMTILTNKAKFKDLSFLLR